MAADTYWLKIAQVGRAVMAYSSPDAQTGSSGIRTQKAPVRTISYLFVVTKLNLIIIFSSAKI
ncbi:hypothetical protein ACQP3F_33150, partial [Escherichia coli]